VWIEHLLDRLDKTYRMQKRPGMKHRVFAGATLEKYRYAIQMAASGHVRITARED